MSWPAVHGIQCEVSTLLPCEGSQSRGSNLTAQILRLRIGHHWSGHSVILQASCGCWVTGCKQPHMTFVLPWFCWLCETFFEPAPHSQINTQLLHSWTVRPSKFLKENVHLQDRRTSILGILHFKVTSWRNELTNPIFYGCVVISLSRKAKVTLKHGPISWPRPGHRVTGTPETIHHAGTTQQPTKGHNTGHHTGASSTSSRHPMPWQFYFRIPWLHSRLSDDCCQFNLAMSLVKDGLGKGFIGHDVNLFKV